MNILRTCKRTFLTWLEYPAPVLAIRIDSALKRRHIRRFEKSIGLDRLTSRFLEANECIVQGGPFAGMSYIARASGSALLPKLLGTYEQELNESIEEAIGRSPKLVLDVGCAEGYYAVGLARRLPETRVIGYDIDSVARNSCFALARSNDVDSRVSVFGHCSQEQLRQRLTPGSLLVCDCEGFEWELLDPDAVPNLVSVDMIIELHSVDGCDCRPEFERRFSHTHFLRFISSVKRKPLCSSPIDQWSERDQVLAHDEFRVSGQQWVWAKAKSP